MAFNFNTGLISAIYSYYAYVVQQVTILNSSQIFGGLINARDWPQTPPHEGALYLLYMNSTPVGGTESQILYEFLCQWVWQLAGTDIQAGQRAQNRGDRFRSNMTIESLLRQASYPSFCTKQSYASDTEGNIAATPVTSAVPSDGGKESVWWSRLRFIPRLENEKSGLTYGAASLRVYAYDDVSVLVA